MAASGIQEHNEARRKERVLMKKANWEKQLRASMQGEGQMTAIQKPGFSENPISAGGSYERELYSRAQCRVVGSPPGIDSHHDAKSVDRQRRMDHYNRQQAEYSAKINGRYRNFDYMSQW